MTLLVAMATISTSWNEASARDFCWRDSYSIAFTNKTCPSNYDEVASVCWAKCPKDWVDCGAGCASSKKACEGKVVTQVFGVLDVLANALSAGANISKSQLKDLVDGSLQKFLKSLNETQTADLLADASQELANAGVNVSEATLESASTGKKYDFDWTTLDPTGISAAVLNFVNDICPTNLVKKPLIAPVIPEKYYDLFEWQEINLVTELPGVKPLSEDDLILDSGKVSGKKMIPCRARDLDLNQRGLPWEAWHPGKLWTNGCHISLRGKEVAIPVFSVLRAKCPAAKKLLTWYPSTPFNAEDPNWPETQFGKPFAIGAEHFVGETYFCRVQRSNGWHPGKLVRPNDGEPVCDYPYGGKKKSARVVARWLPGRNDSVVQYLKLDASNTSLESALDECQKIRKGLEEVIEATPGGKGIIEAEETVKYRTYVYAPFEYYRGANWSKANFKGRDVAVAGDGTVWVIGSNKTSGKYLNRRVWKDFPVGGSRITVSGSKPWIVSNGGYVYTLNSIGGEKFIPIDFPPYWGVKAVDIAARVETKKPEWITNERHVVWVLGEGDQSSAVLYRWRSPPALLWKNLAARPFITNPVDYMKRVDDDATDSPSSDRSPAYVCRAKMEGSWYAGTVWRKPNEVYNCYFQANYKAHKTPDFEALLTEPGGFEWKEVTEKKPSPIWAVPVSIENSAEKRYVCRGKIEDVWRAGSLVQYKDSDTKHCLIVWDGKWHAQKTYEILVDPRKLLSGFMAPWEKFSFDVNIPASRIAVDGNNSPWLVNKGGGLCQVSFEDPPGIKCIDEETPDAVNDVAINDKGTLLISAGRKQEEQFVYWYDRSKKKWLNLTAGDATSVALGPGNRPWVIGKGQQLIWMESVLPRQ